MFDFLKLKKEVSETTTDIDSDDVVSVKTKLKGLGHYKEPEWGIDKIVDNGMFEGIRNFQKEKGLKVDGIMKPQGETEGSINEVIRRSNPVNEIKKSMFDVYDTNNRIKWLAKEKPDGYNYNDKNAHALMSCKVSQNGKLSRAGIGLAGAVRESIQQKTGANTKTESIDDMKANIWGWKQGYENPQRSCEELVEQRYPKYIKRK